MAIQTGKGKGFEYATLYVFSEALKKNSMNVRVEETQSVYTAKSHFESQSELDKKKMLLAAEAGVAPILRFEPNLSKGGEQVNISIQSDGKGEAGDVRDVIFVKSETGWEIGISCKHNHHALKHSRLSSTIDFGKSWLGHPCSQKYFEKVNVYFDRMRELRDETKDLPKEEQNKFATFYPKGQITELLYEPILNAFRDELSRLAVEHTDVPQKLIEYLLGRKDFYKIIAEEKDERTIIQSFNLHNSLSASYLNVKPRNRTKKFENILPNRIYDFDFSPKTKTTLILVMDKGWTISFRIHNASSRIEPSLKFDIQLVGIPPEITNIEEYWGLDE
ncbi:HaeIII family restriction endonuclease [Lactococcus lactis subsp. lactis]|uniref:HaeIII family restriction endonuclease n=1 Tax=Lactococcus lactis TaxID=1358 RepID=UPI00223AE883|nr:HaeIII family restriction endonuclease [Lactococcus lactis]MCT0016892.1 HaeIII family restriction endonuclease [Lactococcus lactis subsp. lactis]